MAAVTVPVKLGPKDDLTDEQIDALLARATERLKAKEEKEKATIERKTPTLPRLDPGNLPGQDSRILLDEKDRKQADNGVREVVPPAAAKRLAIEKKKASAGKDWFDMPRTNVTPELKRDLQMLKMRDVLDPHRHYKKDGGKMKAPEYSQVGTIVEGPTEFFTGRIENKKRKRTFVEEVLAGEQETSRFKRKYGELQGKKTSGKKAYYKEMKAKRRGGVKKGSRG